MKSGGDPKVIYAEAFRRIPDLIDGSDPHISDIEKSLAPLRDGIEFVQRSRIFRIEIDTRLTQYVIPLTVAGDDNARALYVPEFNEAISPKALLWPQVRACWDAERVCLVSVERNSGWFHDLWFPGYLWADTEGKWLVPGINYHDGMSRYEIQNNLLIAAFESLQREELARGRWALGGTRLPFGDELQEQFPLVGRLLDESGQGTVSQLYPDRAARAFEGAFC